MSLNEGTQFPTRPAKAAHLGEHIHREATESEMPPSVVGRPEDQAARDQGADIKPLVGGSVSERFQKSRLIDSFGIPLQFLYPSGPLILPRTVP